MALHTWESHIAQLKILQVVLRLSPRGGGMHMLRYCVNARERWNALIKERLQAEFYNKDRVEWVQDRVEWV